MHILNNFRNKRLPQQPGVFWSKIDLTSILVARQRTLHVLYLFSITILQNIANTLFATIGEIKAVLDLIFFF